MALVTIDYIKDNFELWEEFLLAEDAAVKSPEDMLADKLALGEAELLEYVTVDETTITESLKRHLLNIIKYLCFLVMHGDKDFERKPQIVQDYERTLEALKRHRNSDDISITSKTRQFGKWFHED